MSPLLPFLLHAPSCPVSPLFVFFTEHKTINLFTNYLSLSKSSSPARPFLSGMSHHSQHLVWMLWLCISLGWSSACLGLVLRFAQLGILAVFEPVGQIASCSFHSLYCGLAGAQMKCVWCKMLDKLTVQIWHVMTKCCETFCTNLKRNLSRYQGVKEHQRRSLSQKYNQNWPADIIPPPLPLMYYSANANSCSMYNY